MTKIIAIANQKGGVGKTTTAISLSAALANFNRRVLLLDMDPQGNSSRGFSIDITLINKSMYDVLVKDLDINKAIRKTVIKNVDILPANLKLASTDVEVANKVSNPLFLLKKAIEKIHKSYDYIIIDCPPSLSMLTINAMTTADSVLVPIQCEYYALEGLSQLIHTVELVKERLNPILEIEGVVFTMYDARTNLSLQVVENVKENLQQNIYKTIIPRNIRLAEAPSYGMPINLYDPKSTGASAYQRLADEVMNRE